MSARAPASRADLVTAACKARTATAQHAPGIAADRIGWRKHGDPADLKFLYSFLPHA